MDTSEEDRHELALVEFLHRHAVPIMLTLRKGTARRHVLLSAFVVSARGFWSLITAGHCIDSVKEAESNGESVEFAWLIDTSGQGAKHHLPVPFNWQDAEPLVPFPHEYDLGIVFLTSNTVELLRANNVTPIDEHAWDVSRPPEGFFMLGVPSQWAKLGPKLFTFRPQRLQVEPIGERPAELPDAPAGSWFGRVQELPAGLSTIEGMSGGPVFAWARTDEGVRYWLHAVQSSWHRPTRFVAASPVQHLGHFMAMVADTLGDRSLEEQLPKG